MSTMTGRPVPGPPPHIAALMAEAGRTGNQYELQRAKSLYLGWLHDNGWITDGRQK
jgi:hypothetical protein